MLSRSQKKEFTQQVSGHLIFTQPEPIVSAIQPKRSPVCPTKNRQPGVVSTCHLIGGHSDTHRTRND